MVEAVYDVWREYDVMSWSDIMMLTIQQKSFQHVNMTLDGSPHLMPKQAGFSIEVASRDC